MYSITIQYQTGNEVKTEKHFATFSTLEEAEEFLRTLKAHYLFVDELSLSVKTTTYEEIKNKYCNESWYYKDPHSLYKYNFIFKDVVYELPYIGYFEFLIRASIVFPIED